MLSKTAQEILDKVSGQGADGVSVQTVFEQLTVSKEEFETACQELVDERRVFWTQHKSRSTPFPIGTIKIAANSESAGKRIEYESRQDHLDDMSDDRLTRFIREMIDHLQSSESDVFTAGNQIKEIGRILKLLSERIDRLEKRQQL